MKTAGDPSASAMQEVEDGLARIANRKDVPEAQRDILYRAIGAIMWDDAIHITAPWDERTTLCGNWHRNRVTLDEERPNGVVGCWTCLMAAGWFDKAEKSSG